MSDGMKKKDKVIIAMVIMIICIAAGISYFIFLPEPSYPLESNKLIGTWFRSGEDFFGFPNWTFYFYSNGSGQDVRESGPLTEPIIATLKWEIRNGKLCFNYTSMDYSSCMEGRFIGDYNHLELRVTELMEFGVDIKFIFKKIG